MNAIRTVCHNVKGKISVFPCIFHHIPSVQLQHFVGVGAKLSPKVGLIGGIIEVVVIGVDASCVLCKMGILLGKFFHPSHLKLYNLLDDLLLFLGIIKEDGLSSSSSFFLKYMAMFFVPSGVEIIEYADLLSSSWFHIILISAISMLITFFAAAKAVEITERLMQRRKAA